MFERSRCRVGEAGALFLAALDFPAQGSSLSCDAPESANRQLRCDDTAAFLLHAELQTRGDGRDGERQASGRLHLRARRGEGRDCNNDGRVLCTMGARARRKDYGYPVVE